MVKMSEINRIPNSSSRRRGINKNVGKGNVGKGKLKAGIFAFACCEGCQLQILDLWDRLVKVLDFVDIEYFKLAQQDNAIRDMDIAIVEGAIATKQEAKKLNEIRKKSRFLIAIGECAASGGLPAMRTVNTGNFERPKNLLRRTTGIERHVKVDYRLRGCPIDRGEFLRLIIGLSVGNIPQEINEPVCMECNNREIECLMLKGEPCMGPVTCAGCDALCPSQGAVCEGCRGLMDDSGIRQFRKRLVDIGISKKKIKNMIERFGSDHVNDIEEGNRKGGARDV